MSENGNTWGPGHDAALKYAWGEYRQWAATSRKGKARQTMWRRVILALTVAGAILGTVAYQLHAEGGSDDVWTVSGGVVGVVAGALVGFATFLTKQRLGAERERTWVQARWVAEAIKREIFLFRTQIAPYEQADAPKRLFAEVEALENTPEEGIQQSAIDDDKRFSDLPKGSLTADAYFTDRVDEQIRDFYDTRAKTYETYLDRGQTITLILGLVSVLLGVASFWGWTGAWVAAIATLVAAVGTYLYAERYQYLLISYQGAAAALRRIRARWDALGGGATPEQAAALVQAAESAIASENQAWMAKLLEKDKPAPKPADEMSPAPTR
jgi:hypothetical protein